MLRTDVMVDLETLDVGPDAAIVQIGAVAFNARGDLAVPVEDLLAEAPRLQINVSLRTAVAAGGTIGADTVLWWLRQSEQARAEFAKPDLAGLEDALFDFADWWRTYADPEAHLWGNGADFDPVILGRSFDRLGLVRPWVRWNVRCFRTLRAEHCGLQYQRQGLAHRALDDALSQARHVLLIRRGAAAAADTRPGAAAVSPINP